jgi:hypothetical protein
VAPLAGVVVDADRGAALVAVCVPVLGLAGALPVASASLTGTSVRKIATIPHLTAVRSPAGARRGHRLDGPFKKAVQSNTTSCRAVVYIGDSTSDGETSSDYIPDPKLRLPRSWRTPG